MASILYQGLALSVTKTTLDFAKLKVKITCPESLPSRAFSDISCRRGTEYKAADDRCKRGNKTMQPSVTKTKEKQFFDALKNVFVGVPVEGESGYINLMRIKARYFEKVMEPRLQEEIDDALKPFPDFREELFDKLYTFFRRYFTESGSIGFFFTPYHQSVYEQVYTNEQDVVLFWKTSRLYYVKTDRLFQSMTLEVDTSMSRNWSISAPTRSANSSTLSRSASKMAPSSSRFITRRGDGKPR